MTPFAYAWRWKGAPAWKLTLTKKPNHHPDLEIRELFAAPVADDLRTAVEALAKDKADLAQALTVLMETSKGALKDAEAENERLRKALRSIANGNPTIDCPEVDAAHSAGIARAALRDAQEGAAE